MPRTPPPPPAVIEPLDARITTWMAESGVTLLRVSLGAVFLWFGVLKLFPGVSAAEALAGDTIEVLTAGLVPRRPALLILAVWESLIGLGLLTGRALRTTLFLLFAQMPGTVVPLFVFPGLTFRQVPFVPTLEGQYIIKNLVLLSAALVVGATVRGGRLVPDAASPPAAPLLPGRGVDGPPGPASPAAP